MKPPRKPTGRVPKQSFSHSRTHSRPTTRYATYSSPLHRSAGFGLSARGTEVGVNVAFHDESIRESRSPQLGVVTGPRAGAISWRQLEDQGLRVADETLDGLGARSRHGAGILA